MFEPGAGGQVLELGPFASDQLPSLGGLSHPVQAYLNALAPSSRRPQLSALDWIARRSTQVFTAESMLRQLLRRPHVLKIRALLEEHYQSTTANRMLSALRDVLRECWQGQSMTREEYQAAINVPAVRGESERRGRDLSAVELRGLFDACTRSPGDGRGPDSAARRRRDAAFLALAYGCGLRRSEAVAVDVADLDLVSEELRVRRGKGRKPREVNLPPSAVPALKDWLQVRGEEPGPLFCAVLKSGRPAHDGEGLARLSPATVWRICRERGLKADPGAGPARPAPNLDRRSARPGRRPGHSAEDGGACLGLDHRRLRRSGSGRATPGSRPAPGALYDPGGLKRRS
jgi:integrase/recombinase XerD